MQTLYIADLPLPGEAQTTWASAEGKIDEWVEQRLGLTLPQDGSEHINGTRGSQGRSAVLVGRDGSKVRSWNTRRTNPALPVWAYDVTVWLADDRSSEVRQSLLRVRLSAHSLHGRVAELPQPPSAPGIVRTILHDFEVVADGERLGHPRTLGAAQVPDLVKQLLNQGRQRPVLVLTAATADGEPTIDPVRTAHRLAGLCHVVALQDRSTTHALTEALGGSDLSVFGGAARLYWPGMQLDDPRYDHPLWFTERLKTGGPNRFVDLLFARLGRLSALTLGPPDLEVKLRRETLAQQRAEAAERFAAVTQQANAALRELEQVRSAPQPPVADDEVMADDWFDEYEKTIEELETLAGDRDELAQENEQLRQQLVVARDNIRAMATAASSPRAPDEDDDLEPATAPVTIGEAVTAAASLCSYLVFLPEARTSAAESEYPRPEQVLEDLKALDLVARRWANNELSGGFEAAFVEAGVSCFRPGISSTAQQQYESDYEREYEGKRIMLGPHFARGTGAVTAIMRIYWYLDPNARVIVVGHIGRKLRDDSNP